MAAVEQSKPYRVVVVGGGFGGLQAVLKLSEHPVEITLVDRRNFHLFQPLAYQVATGALAAAEICYPLRHIFRKRQNVRVVLAEVTDIDLDNRRVHIRYPGENPELEPLEYDSLVVSGGSEYNYFGHDAWRDAAAELKTLEGALTLRREILTAFEEAELERDPARQAALLTFAVVGAGPTGVEMAGQIAEIAHDLRGDMRSTDPSRARILLIEMGDRILASFPPRLSQKAKCSLEELGVTPRLCTSVIDVSDGSVTLRNRDGTIEQIETATVVWAAGVQASPLAGMLARRAGVEPGRGGRLVVEPDLSVPGHPEALGVGDMVSVRQPDGSELVLPGFAPVAMQQGRHAARVVAAHARNEPPKPFKYVDKGNLATIGRARAVADVRHVQVSGLLAWVTWLIVHLFYLVGFENRVLVFIRWAFSFGSRERGARLIAHGPEHLGD